MGPSTSPFSRFPPFSKHQCLFIHWRWLHSSLTEAWICLPSFDPVSSAPPLSGGSAFSPSTFPYTTQISISGLNSSKNCSMLFLSSGKDSRRGPRRCSPQFLISLLHPPRSNFKTHALLIGFIKLAMSAMRESTAISMSLSCYLSLHLCPNEGRVFLSKTASYFSCSLHAGM